MINLVGHVNTKDDYFFNKKNKKKLQSHSLSDMGVKL